MVKKVVIAAAGEGTRMLHLTKNKSKHLISVGKRPFLSYLLDNLFLAGYREIILVVGYKEELIKEFIKKYKPPLKSLRKSQYEIKIVSQYEILGPKDVIYGTACPLMCVKESIGKDNFLFVAGDNLYSSQDLKSLNIDDKYNYVAGIFNTEPQKYGVLIEDNDYLKEIVEKPKQFVSNLINTSLYKFTPEVFKKLDKIKKSVRGEYEITDLINALAKEKKVKIKRIKDYWLDFGNPADVIKVSYFLKSFQMFKRLFWKERYFKIISAKSKKAVEEAVKYLERGQVIICPTDTVYGLLADATNNKAVERVFRIKKRDKKKVLPVFVKDILMAKKIAKIDKDMEIFLGEIWPGKITVALEKKKKSGLSKLISGNKKTVGLRIPNDNLVRQILEKIDKPLTGTSANISGKPASTKIKDVLTQFEKEDIRPDLVLDRGDLPESYPSTVIDFSGRKPKIVRSGR